MATKRTKNEHPDTPALKKRKDSTEEDSSEEELITFARSLGLLGEPTSPDGSTCFLADEKNEYPLGLSRKESRTKVFSGVAKNADTVSYYEKCVKVLIKNIGIVRSTSRLPFRVLRPVLEQVSASELRRIESLNPYLLKSTADLWRFHCRKDFKDSEPQDASESWRDLHRRYTVERKNRLQAVAATVRRTMSNATPVRTMQLLDGEGLHRPVGSKPLCQPRQKMNNLPKRTQPTEEMNRQSQGHFSASTFHKPTVTRVVRKKPAPMMAKVLRQMKSRR